MSNFADILNKKKKELGAGTTDTPTSSGGFGSKLAAAQQRLTNPVSVPQSPLQQAARDMAAERPTPESAYRKPVFGNMAWFDPSAYSPDTAKNLAVDSAKKLGATAGGLALNVGTGVVGGLANLADALAYPADYLYGVTGNEFFNLGPKEDRASTALRQSAYDAYQEDAERLKEITGSLGDKIIDLGQPIGNIVFANGLLGPAAAQAQPAADILGATANSSPLASSAAERMLSRIGEELITHPGNLGISLGSGINAYNQAVENGADVNQASVAGLGHAFLEYFSNKMFSGMPFEDLTGEEKGYVMETVEEILKKYGLKEATEKFLGSTAGKITKAVIDKAGEGFEEVITAVGDPVVDYYAYGKSQGKDLEAATPQELWDEFVGGVLLSGVMSGGEALMKQGAKTLGLGVTDQEVFADAVEELRQNGELSPATQRRLSDRPAAQMAYDAAIGNTRASTSAVEEGVDTTAQKPTAQAKETASTQVTAQSYLASVAKKAGYSEAAAESLVQNAPADAAAATAYFDAYNSFYDAGRKGASYEEVQSSGAIPAELGKIAYNWGASDSAVAASQLIGHSDSTAKTPGLLRDEAFKKAKLTAKEARTLDAIGKIGGVEIRLAEKIEAELRHVDENGNEVVTKHAANASFSDGVITISLSAKDPIIAAAVHETVHNIKSAAPEAYASLANFVFNNMSDSFYGANVAVRQSIGYADEDIPEEIVADAFGRMLNDKNLVEQYVRDNRSAAQKIRDALHDFIVKIQRFLDGNQRSLTADQKLAFANLQQKTDAMLTLYDQALKRAGEYRTNGGKKAPADIDPDFAEARYSVAPPYREGTNDYTTFVDALNAEARKTFDLFASIHDYGANHLVKMMVGSGKARHESAGTDITKQFMTAQEWNRLCESNEEFAKAAKGLVALLPDDVRTNGNFLADGTINPELLENEFKMERSFAQRVVDALPIQVVSPVVHTDGRDIKVSNKDKIKGVGGEAYRRALVEERRKLFAEGKLPTRAISGLHKDNWGTMGFLATNTKTVASGDFTTICPQMMFNRGCFYCYRRAALETGVNNKLSAESVWYTGEILMLTDEDVKSLNELGGLRIQSFGDWMEQFSAQLADLLIDAQKRGLQIKFITKETNMIDTVALLREQGIGLNLYFNLSSDYVIEPQGKISNNDGKRYSPSNYTRPHMTTDDGRVWWKRALSPEEAFEWRKKYPFVNVRIVAHRAEEFIRALKDPRIQVVTGYHGKIRHYERYDSTTGELIGAEDEVVYTPKGKIKNPDVEPVGDNGMPWFILSDDGSWSIDPNRPGKNKYQKQLAQQILDEGLVSIYYMKACCVTGRCESCQGKCGKAANDFYVKNATNADSGSVAFWQENMIDMGEVVEQLFPQQRGVIARDQIRWSLPEPESPRDYAPTFFSKLEREIEKFKGDRIGAASAVSYLKGHGVTDEEIKWSGIQTFLEGKKSVDKAELLGYLRDSRVFTDIEERSEASAISHIGYTESEAERLQAINREIDEQETRFLELFKAEYGKDFIRTDETHFDVDAKHAVEMQMYRHGKRVSVSERTSRESEMFKAIEMYLTKQIEAHDLERYVAAKGRKYASRWDDYTTPGGENYREYLFRIPSSSYTNHAMETHWGGNAQGILAHARVQDFWADPDPTTGELKKVLFIDEIQSDWHNAGQKYGYRSGDNADYEAELNRRQREADKAFDDLVAVESQFEALVTKLQTKINSTSTFPWTYAKVDQTLRLHQLGLDASWGYEAEIFNDALQSLTDDDRVTLETYVTALETHNKASSAVAQMENAAEDAPYAKTYQEFVLKNLLRMAAEGDYDYLAWTTGKMQEERWSDEYAEGYRIEYDQEIPGFLKKYGKQWGEAPTSITLYGLDTNLETVPAIAINGDMKDSVLYEGQPSFGRMYSLQENGDADYLAAVERGDMETAQRMVDEAAKKAGYVVRKYHGTKANFTEFDPTYSLYGASGFGHYFGDKEIADEFGENGRVLTVLINNKRIGTLKTHYITADQFETAISRLGLSPEKTYKYMGADTVEEYVRAHHDYRLATDLQYWATSPKKYAVDSATTAKSPKDIISILNNSLGLDGIERGRELVLWDNRLVKLADPVTYDGKGKPIKLSERFNPKETDIRYSISEPSHKLDALYKEYASAVNAPKSLDPLSVYRTFNTDDKSIVRMGGDPIKATEIARRIQSMIDLYRAIPNESAADWAIRQYKKAYSDPQEMLQRIQADEKENVEIQTAFSGEWDKDLLDKYLRAYEQTDFSDIESVKRLLAIEADASIKNDGAYVLLGKKYPGDASQYSISDRDALDAYIKKYGAIEQGESPRARDIELPKRTGKGTRVSKTARTILEAGATPDAIIPDIEKLAAHGSFTYNPYSDKQAIQDADAEIRRVGWKDALADWYRRVGDGIVSKANTAEGWALYNNAANAGDTAEALRILRLMVRHQRNAAQAVQATRILKQLAPEAQLYNVAKSIEELQREIDEKYGGKSVKLVIDQDLADAYLAAQTDEERERILQAIYRDIGRQMPSRFIDRWNAWRYLAMLGNPRTHVRNTLGNAGFAPIVLAKDALATGIESAVGFVAQKKGKDFQRTKANIIGKGGGELLSAAWGDFANVEDEALGEGKYAETKIGTSNKYVREGQQEVLFRRTKSKTFNRTFGRAIDAINHFNSNALNAEDVWFSQPHYAMALAQYCKANGITAAQIRSGKGLVAAREYAVKEAQKATYRDVNQFSQLISQLGRGQKLQTTTAGKVLNAAAEGVMPFRKTPANILVRGVEYSPIGLLKSITYDAVQVKKGNMSGAEMIDHLAAGLTGTGLVALGVLLSSLGLIRGHGSPDEKKKTAEELAGHQAYSLEVGGKSITLDWLAPECLPFFIGVNLAETAKEEKGDVQMKDVLASVTNISEPLLELSCLQGINDLLDNLSYAKNNGINALTAMAASTATSYLTQALPTIAGQAERTTEGKRFTTYTDKNKWLMSDVQYALGKASGKVPVWEYGQIPYIDAWGKEDLSGNWLLRVWRNFINPSYVNDVDQSAMEKELLRLYDKTGDGGVLPSRPSRYFNVNGERKDLTGEEYVKYATACGQTAYGLVGKLTTSSEYKAMTDSNKADVLSDAYDYAMYTARTLVGGSIPDSKKWIAEAQKGREDYTINPDVYILAKHSVSGIKSIKDKNGKTIANSYGLQVMEMIYNMKGLTDRQRQYLFECFDVGSSVIGYSRDQVRKALNKMR